MGNIMSLGQQSPPDKKRKLQQKIEEIDKNIAQLRTRLAELKSHQNELQSQNSHVDPASTEVDHILKQLEEQISQNATLEDNLEEQDKSTKLIIQELEQQIAELEEGHVLFLNELEEKEREYLQEMDNLEERVDNLYINIACSICQAPWTSEGEHRLISLYCGHIFGKECIQRLTKCPFCGMTFSSTNMRSIYGRNILPAD